MAIFIVLFAALRVVIGSNPGDTRSILDVEKGFAPQAYALFIYLNNGFKSTLAKGKAKRPTLDGPLSLTKKLAGFPCLRRIWLTFCQDDKRVLPGLHALVFCIFQESSSAHQVCEAPRIATEVFSKEIENQEPKKEVRYESHKS